MAGSIGQTIEELPNKNAYEWGYGVGYGSEKIVEGVLLSKGAGFAANAVKNSGGIANFARLSSNAARSSTKLIGPAGDAGALVTRQVPSNWIMKSAKKGVGTRFVDPTNAGNHIRVMRGNPSSPFLNSQTPYTIRYINGAPVNRFGNQIINNTGTLQNRAPSLHVPINQFKF